MLDMLMWDFFFFFFFWGGGKETKVRDQVSNIKSLGKPKLGKNSCNFIKEWKMSISRN